MNFLDILGGVVQIMTLQDRFIFGRTLTFKGLRWSRTYGLTTQNRWGDEHWLGKTSWKPVLTVGAVTVMRCKYGYQPQWVANNRWVRCALNLISLCLPTTAGRHARDEFNRSPSCARRTYPQPIWQALRRIFTKPAQDLQLADVRGFGDTMLRFLPAAGAPILLTDLIDEQEYVHPDEQINMRYLDDTLFDLETLGLIRVRKIRNGYFGARATQLRVTEHGDRLRSQALTARAER